MTDKPLERGYGSDTDIDVFEPADETTPSVRQGRDAGRGTSDVSGKSGDIGGYGRQSEAGGAATAAAKESGQAGTRGSGAGMAGFTGVSSGVTGSGVGTSGLAKRSSMEDEQTDGRYVSGDGGKEEGSIGDVCFPKKKHGGAEAGSVVTSAGMVENASEHAIHGSMTGDTLDEGRDGLGNRSTQGSSHNSPGSGAE